MDNEAFVAVSSCWQLDDVLGVASPSTAVAGILSASLTRAQPTRLHPGCSVNTDGLGAPTKGSPGSISTEAPRLTLAEGLEGELP